MYALEVLEQLESASGSNAKKSILKQHSHHTRLKELLDAALNFKRKFHVKKFNDEANVEDMFPDAHWEFTVLLDRLENKEITGNEAVTAVEDFFKRCTTLEAKWYARVLRKDLKIGVKLSTVNDCGFNIFEYGVQLAKDGFKCKKVHQMIADGAYYSCKLNGYRCTATIENGTVTLQSRNGTVFENFPSIEEAVLKAWGDQNVVLDGEIMSNSFNEMQQSAFASKRGTVVGDVTYRVFDCVPLSEWNSNDFVTPASKRYEKLDEMFNGVNDQRLIKVIHTRISSYDELLEKMDEYVAQGDEGIMLNPDIPYYRGKPSNKMLKFKPIGDADRMPTMEATVTGFYCGRPGTALENTLGGITVVQENGVECKLGSGFDLEQRNWIWQNQEKVQGRVLEAKYQELTPKNKMYLPIFVRWRPDKETV